LQPAPTATPGGTPLANAVRYGCWDVARLLVAHGADVDWVPDYAKGTPLDAATGEGTRRANLMAWLREHDAHSEESDG
jgi:uncharacterized protein